MKLYHIFIMTQKIKNKMCKIQFYQIKTMRFDKLENYCQ